MIKATLGTQLMINVDNKVGTLADVTNVISASGINLIAACAYVIDSKGFIMFVTEDNKAAQKLLKAKKYDVRVEEVILLTLDNKPGALESVAKKISHANIDLTFLYGSVDKKAKTSTVIMVTENNSAVEALLR